MDHDGEGLNERSLATGRRAVCRILGPVGRKHLDEDTAILVNVGSREFVSERRPAESERSIQGSLLMAPRGAGTPNPGYAGSTMDIADHPDIAGIPMGRASGPLLLAVLSGFSGTPRLRNSRSVKACPRSAIGGRHFA